MMGQSLRQAFEITLSHGGSTVSISSGAPDGTQAFTAKALKHRDDGGDYFAFLDQGDIVPGSVIARSGVSERWIVDRIEPSITSDVLVKVKAYVHLDASPGRHGKRISSGDVVIHATNSQVTLQHGGHGNIQKVVISNRNDISHHLDDLRRIISESSLEEVDKEDAHVEIARVGELVAKSPTPDILNRINDRLGVLGKIVSRVTSLAAAAGPALELIRKGISGG